MKNNSYFVQGVLRSTGSLAVVVFAAIILLMAPVAGFTQATSSAIQGTLTDPSGSPVSGATLTVRHIATGTRSTTQTNNAGVYRFPGLRVGGPYEVTLSGTTVYGEERIEQVFIALGEPYLLDLVTRVTEIEEIVVSASQQDAFFRMGAASSFDSNNIDGQANVNRDFKNIIAQDARVMLDPTNQNAVSIAGSNNRFNSLTIDGVRQNDDFGLNNSGFPTQRAPISIDAIEQMTVEIAPFDVSYGGFTGGTINAVTKSGTNEWNGSVTVFNSNDDLLGDKTKTDAVSFGNFDEDTLAFTLSGPIIKDRLWFFVSYEEFTATDTSALDFGPVGSGRPNEVSTVTQADITAVSDIARNRVEWIGNSI